MFVQWRATTTTPDYLRSISRADTSDHLAYVGSDAQYHYVYHSQLFDGGSFRVPLTAWTPPRTFPVGAEKPYLLDRSMLTIPVED